MINWQNYKSILCLDGDLPAADFFAKNLPIIAADGGANKLMKMGIEPQIVIGDLDGIHQELKPKLKLLHKPDQNYSDFQKSLSYLAQENLLPTIVTGINGGYLDHILNNVNIFVQTNSVLYAPPIIGLVLNAHSETNLTLPIDTKLSLLGMPNAIVTSLGLKWELEQFALQFPGQTSCFNRTTVNNINLTVHDGKVLLLMYEN